MVGRLPLSPATPNAVTTFTFEVKTVRPRTADTGRSETFPLTSSRSSSFLYFDARFITNTTASALSGGSRRHHAPPQAVSGSYVGCISIACS